MTLSSSKSEYVVGEPVQLIVVLENPTDKPSRVSVDVLKWQVFDIEISDDAQGFRRFEGGTLIWFDVAPTFQVIAPGAKKYYVMRVLYTDPFLRQSQYTGLAFPEPGEYSVKVTGVATPTTTSNTIEVKIARPMGIDARVWAKLNSTEMLRLLQMAPGAPKTKQAALTAAEVLKSIPDSSYHDDLRWALAKWYYRYDWGRSGWTDEEMTLVREALGLDRWPEFPAGADRRLDLYYVKYGPRPGVHGLNEFLAAITKETGVSLRSEFREGDCPMGFSRTRKPVPLRVYMQWMTAPGWSAWFGDDDGYVLKLIERREEQRSKTAPTEEDAAPKPSQ